MHWIALQLEPETSQEAKLIDSHTALGWWGLQFTPWVARVEDALVLEVSGSMRLFGGGAALVAQLLKQNKPVALMGYAQGATSLVALGRLWGRSPESSADELPLTALVAARPHLPVLARIGCTRWGHVRSLPRGGVARRFGAGLVAALDRAYGASPEVYPWVQLPEVFDARLELSASVEDAAAMLFGARRLIAQLQVWLRARQRGVLALELLWEMDVRRCNALHIDAHHAGGSQGQLLLRTAQPTQDMQHLQRLLAEQLAHVTLPSPVLYIRLRTVQTQALAGESMSLLPQDARPGDSLQQLIERLSARLGPQKVLSATLQSDHRPERMQHWQGALESLAAQPRQFATNSVAGYAISTGISGLFPRWLLASPQRLPVREGMPQFHGVLELLAGPQRLEAGWLEGQDGCALRDYYVARSSHAGLVWVYCDRLGTQGTPGPHWYLHGIFA